ncbi:MAG: MmcQ/YjbR family DNA-binding protein [Clostridia bacterium]|nr:MmcQ/YjbR family DNA-binding protein [Clostridia bacterium]
MSIEKNIFQRKKIIFEKLVPFGFVKDGSVFRYSESFMNGDFSAEIEIAPDGAVRGRVIDLSLDEDYLPLRVESAVGAYVGTVRQAYSDILKKIADSCFENRYFLFDQANKIAALIHEKYNESPDFPFADSPTVGVFRYPGNRKWYGLIMNIRLRQLTGEAKNDPETSPEVEVMNVKVGEERMSETLKIPNVFPSYHMQKKNWVSILFDHGVPDETVMELISISREFAISKKSKK